MWLAVITGVGGGTVRDLILGVPVFWVQNPVHVAACLATAVGMHFVAPLVESRYRTLLWFDAFGRAGHGPVRPRRWIAGAPALVAISMGAVTGTVGGMIRNTLGHVPSRRVPRHVHRPRTGDQVRVVAAGLPRISHA